MNEEPTNRMNAERESLTNEELISAFYAGDDASYDVLDRRHRNRLAGLAHQLFLQTWSAALPNLQEAIADVVQNTMLKVIRSRSRQATAGWREGRSVKPWLNQILRNEVVNYLRALGRYQFETDASAEDGSSLSSFTLRSDDGRSTRSSPPDVATQAEESEQAERLRRFVEALPPRQREVMLLKFWGGLSQTEIADSLGTTSPTISREVARAMQTLQKQLSQQNDGAQG